MAERLRISVSDQLRMSLAPSSSFAAQARRRSRLAYPANDSFARAVADRVALNARDAGISIQPSPSPNGNLRLVRWQLESTDAAAELARLAGMLGLAGTRQLAGLIQARRRCTKLSELCSTRIASSRSYILPRGLRHRAARAQLPRMAQRDALLDCIWKICGWTRELPHQSFSQHHRDRCDRGVDRGRGGFDLVTNSFERRDAQRTAASGLAISARIRPARRGGRAPHRSRRQFRYRPAHRGEPRRSTS